MDDEEECWQNHFLFVLIQGLTPCPSLTVDDLVKEHLSVPVNPFIARPFYLAGYINQLGYGTRNVVEWCLKAGLPDPKFDPAENRFRVTIWRNWLTDERMKRLNLNERQVKAVQFLKSDIYITNTEYQKLTGVSRATAKRDLDEMVKLGLLKLEGAGRSAHYRLAQNWLINGSNGSPEHKTGNGS